MGLTEADLTRRWEPPTLSGMQILRTREALDNALDGGQPGFVPTMGALHEGHLALIHNGKQRLGSAGPLLVSIFVNPTQFGVGEDFSRYPRTLDADIAGAAGAGADLAFVPDVVVIYPPGEPHDVPPMPTIATLPKLEDAHRPTHFAGVCQVVARLFDLIRPAFAVLGEKDFQQLRVIQAMVRGQPTRWPGLEIVPHPTVREPDGLAMSSRNRYLQPQDREHALGLSRALAAARLESTPLRAEAAMRSVLQQHELVIDYAVVRDHESLLPIESFAGGPARALIAARLGSVRLIDNQAMK